MIYDHLPFRAILSPCIARLVLGVGAEPRVPYAWHFPFALPANELSFWFPSPPRVTQLRPALKRWPCRGAQESCSVAGKRLNGPPVYAHSRATLRMMCLSHGSEC